MRLDKLPRAHTSKSTAAPYNFTRSKMKIHKFEDQNSTPESIKFGRTVCTTGTCLMTESGISKGVVGADTSGWATAPERRAISHTRNSKHGRIITYKHNRTILRARIIKLCIRNCCLKENIFFRSGENSLGVQTHARYLTSRISIF